MKKKHIRDTPEIVIPKGYGIDDLLDFDDEGYRNGNERIRTVHDKDVFYYAQLRRNENR